MNVLDASALLIAIREEPGWERLADLLHGASILSVNLAEAADRQFRDGWTRTQFRDFVATLGVVVAPLTEQIALDAAEFRDAGRRVGLSQADCLCLAFGRHLGIPVLTADQGWSAFADTIGVRLLNAR